MASSQQSETKRSRTPRKNTQSEFESKSLAAMPRWAWAFCAILMALSLSVRQMGLDISSPLNRIMTAHAVRIEKTAGPNLHNLDEIKALVDELKSYERRVIELERWAHKPNGDPIERQKYIRKQ